MINEHKTYEILNKYIDDLDKLGYTPILYNLNELPEDREHALNYCMWMLHEMQDIVSAVPFLEGKFFRWLGFVQGVLWREHIYTINELMEDNTKIISV